MSKPRQVLVVDDDQDIRDILELALGMEGYQVIAASDRKSALQCIHDNPPQFVLLDYYMQGLDPENFIAELRKMNFTAPVLLMTAAHDGKEKANRLGVELLPKPFDLDVLLSRIRDTASV